MSVVPVLSSNNEGVSSPTYFVTESGLQVAPAFDSFVKSSLPSSVAPSVYYSCLSELVEAVGKRVIYCFHLHCSVSPTENE